MSGGSSGVNRPDPQGVPGSLAMYWLITPATRVDRKSTPELVAAPAPSSPMLTAPDSASRNSWNISLLGSKARGEGVKCGIGRQNSSWASAVLLAAQRA